MIKLILQIPKIHIKLYVCFFKEQKSSIKFKFSVRFIKTLLHFTFYHNYIFFYNNIIYKQYQEILQGCTASSVLSQIYLYYYERNSFGDTNYYVSYRYIDFIAIEIIIFYFCNSSFTSLYTQFPTQLILSQISYINLFS